jgi:hypothetical protein
MLLANCKGHPPTPKNFLQQKGRRETTTKPKQRTRCDRGGAAPSQRASEPSSVVARSWPWPPPGCSGRPAPPPTSRSPPSPGPSPPVHLRSPPSRTVYCSRVCLVTCAACPPEIRGRLCWAGAISPCTTSYGQIWGDLA